MIEREYFENAESVAIYATMRLKSLALIFLILFLTYLGLLKLQSTTRLERSRDTSAFLPTRVVPFSYRPFWFFWFLYERYASF